MAASACAAPDNVVIGTADGRALTGTIKTLSNGAVQVLLPEFMSEGSQVRVEFSARCTVSGEVKYCNPYQRSYCVSIYFEALAFRGSRSFPRLEVQEDAMVAVMNCPARSQLFARVTDASKSGLGLILRRPLQANDWVRVETHSCVVVGNIVYCRMHAGGGYKAGLEIETVVFRSGIGPAVNEKRISIDEGQHRTVRFQHVGH
jgi:hypothetical protein